MPNNPFKPAVPFQLGQAMGLLTNLAHQFAQHGCPEFAKEADELAKKVHDLARRALGPLGLR